MASTDLNLWDKAVDALPEKPSDYTRALSWVTGILAGCGVAFIVGWALFYKVPWTMMSHHHNAAGKTISSYHTFSTAGAITFDVVLGLVVLTFGLAAATDGLRELERKRRQ